HIGNMDWIIKQYDIGAFYMPKKSHTTDAYKDMANALLERDIKAKEAKSGVLIDFDSQVECEFLAPIGTKYDDLNDYSAVLKITFGNTSFLLAADAEKTSEDEMISKYGALLKSDVLKAGHHGNGSSSTLALLALVKPQFSAISMKDINEYGDPQDKLNFFKRFTMDGGKLYRTDVDGDITFISDGMKITVETSGK
ncbi:MAG: MBL fold metallo-hydrolase, partial [Bacillota bacterium]|nr:MBL fold metallo-hydrolase [Bacillota bacterium]